MPGLFSELEAEQERERKAAERERRSNRVLDIRVNALEQNAVRGIDLALATKRLRSDILMAYVCILIIDLTVLALILRVRKLEGVETEDA